MISAVSPRRFGVFDMSIDNGERNSTAKAYLDPARPRQNLKVITDAQVQKILSMAMKLLVLATRKQMERPLKLRHRKKSS